MKLHSNVNCPLILTHALVFSDLASVSFTQRICSRPLPAASCTERVETPVQPSPWRNAMHQRVIAKSAGARIRSSNYPPEFAQRMAGRVKRPLGDLFALRNFGVNLTTLSPGGSSALFHRHSRQDEFIYILQGEVV